MIEANFGFQILSCRCSVKWLSTYSNLVEYDRQLHNDDRDASSFVWELAFLALGFLASFLSSLGGAPKIDLPLSKFSLARLILTSVFSISVLLAGGTKTVILVEAVLKVEIPYPKPVRSEVDF